MSQLELKSTEDGQLVIQTPEGYYTFSAQDGVEFAIMMLKAAHACGATVDMGRLFKEMRDLQSGNYKDIRPSA